MFCVICGRRPIESWVCSDSCDEELQRRVVEVARSRHPELYSGKELVIDPCVGDEYAIARCNLEMKVWNELTRPARLALLERGLENLGLPTELAEPLMKMVEAAPGMNFQDFEVRGRFITVYLSGRVEEDESIPRMRRWRVDEERRCFVEEDPDEYWRAYGLERQVIPFDRLRYPRYGDLEGSASVSIIEHGKELAKGPNREGERDGGDC